MVHVFSKFDRKTLEFMAEAVRDGKLVIPISRKLPLSEAAENLLTSRRQSEAAAEGWCREDLAGRVTRSAARLREAE